MSWPLSHEFNEAIQNPRTAFLDPDLQGGEAVVGATGLPLPRSGNFADVYQVRGADGREWAVKCFTRPVVGLGDRYAEISKALGKANLPFAVGFTFLSEGIRVAGAFRPVVKMEWVEGLLLNQVARENASSPKVLTALGQMWVKLCKRLREAGIAHADIQHGNVLLVPGSRVGAYGLKLIDYDGMWVPALANTPSGESGHPSYQHPARAATRAYSPDVDRFPHLAVATALRGLLVGGSALWEKYDNGDNVLFTEADYKKPAASELMKQLWHAGDPLLQALVGRLAIACGKPIPQTPWLDQLAPEGEPAPLDEPTRRAAAGALGISLPVPVPLPPEPVVAAPLPPAPLPPAPAPVPLPPAPFVFPPPPSRAPTAAQKPLIPIVLESDEPEGDVELVEKPQKKQRARAKQPEKAGAPNARVLLYAGAGLLLLVGGVLAGVLMAGGKQKPETVQQKPDEPKEPGTKGQGEAAKPNDKSPDPVGPTSKDKGSGPLPFVRPPERIERIEPRVARTFPLADTAWMGTPLCGRDSRSVLIQGGNGTVLILDLETGKPLASPEDQFDRNMVARALDGGRFAAGRLAGTRPPGILPVWDPREGKVAESLPTVGLPFPSILFISPTGKYIAGGTNTARDGAPETFRLKGTQPARLIIDDMNWFRGSVFFTDDESRVLVAGTDGKCQWFKLPSGDPDGEWTIEKKGANPAGKFQFAAASGDGSVVVYTEEINHQPRSVHVLDTATKRVRNVPLVGFLRGPPTLSRDGRLLLLHTLVNGRSEVATVVDTVTGEKLGEIDPPPGYNFFSPALLPNGRGAVAVAGERSRRAVVLYDFAPGGVAAKPPEPPPPAPPVVPVDPQALKPRWTVQTDDHMHRLYWTASGKVVLGGAAGNRGGVALDAATGAPRAEFADFVKGGASAFYPLVNERVGKWQLGAQSTRLAHEQTGKEYGQQGLFIPPRPEGGFPIANLSPNNRFIATGWTQNVKFEKRLPLFVYDLRQNKKALVELEWSGGTVHFTTDSARVLVAEHTGKCRWYKLPSGEPDDGWDFGKPAHWMHKITGTSADGSVLAYIGVLDGRLTSGSVDGKTGKLIQRVHIANSTVDPAVSADGKRVAVPATAEGGFYRVDVIDARTGAVVGRIPTGSRLVAFAFSRDGSALALATATPNTVQVFDLPGAPGAAAPAPEPGPGVAGPVPAPRAPPDRLDVREGWTADLPADFHLPKLYATGDSKFVAGISNNGTALVLDAATGKTVPSGFNKAAWVTRLQPVGGSRLALGALGGGNAIGVVDVKTGETTSVPGITTDVLAGPKHGMTYQFVSPDLRYVARGAASNNDPLPFKLKDNTTGQFVREFDWVRGKVFFTADSSRVLVAEGQGRYRWFKLPSGELEKEWTLEPVDFNKPGVKGLGVISMSADGSVLVYDGELVGHAGAYHVIDGRTGKVTRSLSGYSPQFGTASADSGLAVLAKRGADGKLRTADVINLATGKVLAELPAPAGSDSIIPTVLPDGSGVLAHVGPNKVVRIDFVVPGKRTPPP